MASWKGIVAKNFAAVDFPAYVKSLRWGTWRPSFIVLHNTAVPSLAQRPVGFTLQHMRNLEAFYRDQKGWSAGPHLFIDDRQIWAFTPLTTSGVHSPSWNSVALGIEMLGDYASESFTDGRGLLVRRNTVVAMAALNNALGFQADAFRFHVEDTRSDHNCPGRKARACRADLVREIQAAMGADAPATLPAPPSSAPVSVRVSHAPATEASRSSLWSSVWRWLKSH